VCGITGWVDWNMDLTQYVPVMKKMTASLSKRGPDALKVWGSHNILLGHARLVVVDPKGGLQPMVKVKNGKKYHIIYNGELYNTEDLRKELLKRGYSFNSYSDTEVLLTTYLEWKEECVKYLNGIFAFAIWDEEKEELFMARDRLGVKPLFYSENNGSLIFASEIKAILAHPQRKAEIEREGLQELFGLGPSRTPGHGIFRGINEIRPAYAAIFNRNGFKKWRYWQVESHQHQHSLNDTIKQVSNLVKDAIERQLVADVPVCTFLSGGVDSSAISAITSAYFKKEGRGPLHTYSIDYEQNQQYFKSSLFQPEEDTPWISKMEEYLKTNHHALVINHEILVDYLDKAVFVRDLPGMADVDASLLWFCEQIKENFTVSLSGECADEIFGGYPWFYRDDLLNANGFPWMTSAKNRQDLLRAHWQKKLKLNEYVLERYNETIAEVPKLEGETVSESRRREMFYLNMIWFMPTLLERKDRMSMGASLEVRVPFADHRIVEYAWNIPWNWKMLNGREKGLLRKSLEGILPNDVLYRKKSPYPKTHHPLYIELVKKKLKNILEKKSSPILELISKQKIQELIDSNGASFKKPWFGQLMTGPQLLAHISQINTWLEQFNINILDH
jgi:asparagine synthase (glutamine-hydrolysing)